jgi:hypothetical protein
MTLRPRVGIQVVRQLHPHVKERRAQSSLRIRLGSGASGQLGASPQIVLNGLVPAFRLPSGATSIRKRSPPVSSTPSHSRSCPILRGPRCQAVIAPRSRKCLDWLLGLNLSRKPDVWSKLSPTTKLARTLGYADRPEASTASWSSPWGCSGDGSERSRAHAARRSARFRRTPERRWPD